MKKILKITNLYIMLSLYTSYYIVYFEYKTLFTIDKVEVLPTLKAIVNNKFEPYRRILNSNVLKKEVDYKNELEWYGKEFNSSRSNK